jgi:hypothetical protein
MRLTKHPLSTAGLLFGVFSTFLAIVGQVIAGLTFAGDFSSTSVAAGYTSLMALLGFASFAIIWLVSVKRFGLRGGSEKRLLDGGSKALRRIVGVLSVYGLLTFIGLLFLGGFDNKGIHEASGHYYILHAHNERTEVSRAEYWRQAAYPLWMFSAWVLWTAAALIALTERAYFGRAGPPQVPRGAQR